MKRNLLASLALKGFTVCAMIAALSSVSGAQLIDDFSSGDLSAYTSTVMLDNGAAPNTGSNTVAWTSTDATAAGQLGLDVTAFAAVDQIAYTRTDVTLNNGDELQADFTNPIFGRNFGLLVGNAPGASSVGNGGDARADFLMLTGVGGNGRVQARWFDGTTENTSGTAYDPTGTDPFETYFIKKLSDNDYETGVYEGFTRTIVQTIALTNSNSASHIGFYADVRDGNNSGVGLYGTADNLRIVSAVPEPGSIAVLGLAGLIGLIRRRKS